MSSEAQVKNFFISEKRYGRLSQKGKESEGSQKEILERNGLIRISWISGSRYSRMDKVKFVEDSL